MKFDTFTLIMSKHKSSLYIYVQYGKFKKSKQKKDSMIKQVNLLVTIFEHGAYFLLHPKQLNFCHQSHLT
jgi:hypothetical protein